MLQITIPSAEGFNESSNTFFRIDDTVLQLEHSLLSISKWEANWRKPYLSKDPKTVEQCIDYIRCMTLNKNVNPNVYYLIKAKELKKINAYVEAPMTATTFSKQGPGGGSSSRQIITSELLYYYMIAYDIPFECQKWHLNRLLTLIKICDIKSKTPKKMSKNSILSQNSSLNKARRAALNSKG